MNMQKENQELVLPKLVFSPPANPFNRCGGKSQDLSRPEKPNGERLSSHRNEMSNMVHGLTYLVHDPLAEYEILTL